MSGWEQKSFLDFILKNQVVGFFEHPIQLKSGRNSSWYVNWRTITNDVFLIDQLTDYVVNYLKSNWPNCKTIYGVPEGATKTALLAQYKWAKLHHCSLGSHTLSMGRAQPKLHGSPQDQFFIGTPQSPVVVLEDTTTTGASLLKTVDSLLSAQIDVVAALSLTYRSEKTESGLSVPDYFTKKYNNTIPFVSLSDGHEILSQAFKEFKPEKNIIQNIQNEFSQYGTKPLELSV